MSRYPSSLSYVIVGTRLPGLELPPSLAYLGAQFFGIYGRFVGPRALNYDMFVSSWSFSVGARPVYPLCYTYRIGHESCRCVDMLLSPVLIINLFVERAHVGLCPDDPWDFEDFLNARLAPARGSQRVLMQKVPPSLMLYTVQSATKGEMADCP